MPCNVAVVGAGLVGCLQAFYLTQRGHHVVVFEKRQDLRKDDTPAGRSINLALSERGRAALKRVGLEQAVLDAGVPVYGRMVHEIDGRTHAMRYGVLPDQYNYAIDRRRLNCLLLDTIEQKGVTIHFGHRLTSASFTDEAVSLTFANEDKSEVFDQFDFVFGCDGAFSALRSRVIEASCTDFSLKYIDQGYRELVIAPTKDGKPALELNYLHLWARDDYMLMGLPNPDNSFTVTLFMPMHMFETINTAEKLTKFFESNFPDAMPHLGGREGLLAQYKVTKAKPGKLMTIRLDPHQSANGRVVLMGDAAHGMVPFYAQGMNCAFEDCIVMDEALDAEMKKANSKVATKEIMRRAILNYGSERVKDAQAICDLAEYNLIEMRHLVNVWWFRWRKTFDYGLYRLLGGSAWVPRYIAVSYTRMPYSTICHHRDWQDSVLHGARVATVLACGAVLAYHCYRPVVKNLKLGWGDIRIFN